jgi:PKD repeat protein
MVALVVISSNGTGAVTTGVMISVPVTDVSAKQGGIYDTAVRTKINTIRYRYQEMAFIVVLRC